MGSICAENNTSRVTRLFGDLIAAEQKGYGLPPEVVDVTVGGESSYRIDLAYVLASGAQLAGPTILEYEDDGPFGIPDLADTPGYPAVAARLLEHIQGRRPWPADCDVEDRGVCRDALGEVIQILVEDLPDTDDPYLQELLELAGTIAETPAHIQGRIVDEDQLHLVLELMGYQVLALPDPAWSGSVDESKVAGADFFIARIVGRGRRPEREIWAFRIEPADASGDRARHIVSVTPILGPATHWTRMILELGDYELMLDEIGRLGGRAEVRITGYSEQPPVVRVIPI